MLIGTLALLAFTTYEASSSALWLAQRRLIFGKPKRIRPLADGPLADRHCVTTLRLPVSAAVSLEGWCAIPHDTRIPHQSSLALWERLRGPEQLGIVPGANHKTLPRHPDNQARIAAFLNPQTPLPG